MKYADKVCAKYLVVIGEDEVNTDIAKLKDMQTGESTEVSLTTFVNAYYSVSMESQLKDLEINGEAFDFNSLFSGGNVND